MTANGTEQDDTVYLNSADTYFYGQSNPVADDYDATSTLERELSEAMGRDGGLGLPPNKDWGVMDLFRYSAVGQRDYTGGSDGKPTYFSVNGTTLLTQFNNPVQVAGDAADWNPSTQDQEATDVTGGQIFFGAADTGTVGIVTSTDLTVMDFIGWNLKNVPPTLAITSAGGSVRDLSQSISGTIDTADADVTVSIYDGSTLIGTAAPSVNGAWGTTVNLLSTPGAESITAQATDAAGLLGTSNSVTYTLLHAVAVDFTGDGTSDVLLQNGGTVVDWLMQNGLYSTGNVLTAGVTGYTTVGTGDFIGNGTADALLKNGGTVMDWIMSKGQYQSGNVLTTGATGYTVVGTGDFTANGTDDVLLQNGGTVVDWIMKNGQYQSGNVVTTGATGFTVVGTGDYNGDETSDVLLQNGGTVVDWIMKNGQYSIGNVVTTGATGFTVSP